MPAALSASQLGRSHARCAPAYAILAWGTTTSDKAPHFPDDPVTGAVRWVTEGRKP